VPETDTIQGNGGNDTIFFFSFSDSLLLFFSFLSVINDFTKGAGR